MDKAQTRRMQVNVLRDVEAQLMAVAPDLGKKSQRRLVKAMGLVGKVAERLSRKGGER